MTPQGAVDGSREDADSVGAGVAECGADGGAAVGEACGHGEDALGADGVEEPGDEGAGQAVPGVDGQAGVVDEDGLVELGVGVGVGGLAGRDVGARRCYCRGGS
jgi:hypothetical protein